MTQTKRTLQQQRIEFANSSFMATPLAGLIAWSVTGVAGLFLPIQYVIWILFIATGSIAYMGMFISKFTGENFLDKKKPKNEFDQLFMYTVVQALLVYSIALPFFMVDYSSLPLTVGILTGLMWVPFSWIIKHWVGLFHAIVRTITVLLLWYLLPEHRFVAIPFAIVGIYVITIIILKSRKKTPIEVVESH